MPSQCPNSLGDVSAPQSDVSCPTALDRLGCHPADMYYPSYFPTALHHLSVINVIRCQLSELSGIKCMLFFIQLLPAWPCIQMARSKAIELCIPFYSTKLAAYSKQGGEYWCHYQGSKGRKKCFLTFKVARCLHTLLRAKGMASFSYVTEKILDWVNEQFLNPCPKVVLRTT